MKFGVGGGTRHSGPPLWKLFLVKTIETEGKVLEGHREGPQVHRTRFEDLVDLLKQEYALKGRKTWIRREQHIGHLKKVFGKILVKTITSEKLQGYVQKRLAEGVCNSTINRELDCLHRGAKALYGVVWHGSVMGSFPALGNYSFGS